MWTREEECFVNHQQDAEASMVDRQDFRSEEFCGGSNQCIGAKNH
jgi:hypothetical protein